MIEPNPSSGSATPGDVLLRAPDLLGVRRPLAIVVMGVSACGKSTFGRMLAGRLGVRFVDADDLHCAMAKAQMAAGIPLADADRWPWLRRVGEVMAAETSSGGSVVVACSALRRGYRDLLAEVAAPVAFVHLHVTRERLEERLAQRTGHFMPPALLSSQLATLEPLETDERGLTLAADAATGDAVEQVVATLVP